MNVTLHIDGKPVMLEKVARKNSELSFTLAGTPYSFRIHRLPDGSFLLEREVTPGVWQRISGSVGQGPKDSCHVQLGALEAKISEASTASAQAAETGALSPLAPMPGLVRQILVKPGERVEQGQALAVMEAMKLQMTLVAGGAAKVEKLLVREGEMIAEGTELVKLTAIKGEAA